MALLGTVPRSSVALTVTDAAVCAAAGDAVAITARALAAIMLMVVNRASPGLARRCVRLIGTSMYASSKRASTPYLGSAPFACPSEATGPPLARSQAAGHRAVMK